MIIEEFIPAARDEPPNILNICRQDCAPKINPCDNIYDALTVRCSAGRAQGHICDDAIFDAYILLWEETQLRGKDVWEYVQKANFNNRRSGATITVSIELSTELVTRANGGKAERGDCCNLSLALFPSPYPSSIALPYEDERGIFVPPFGSDSYIVSGRRADRVHNNIVKTTVLRNSDGLILAPPFIWQGAGAIDLCVGLVPPEQPPENPVYPVI